MEASGSDVWDDAKWNRYGYLAGVVFVVVGLAATFAPGAPPDRDASGDEIAKYVVDNAGGLKLAAVLFALSMLLGIFWLGSLWRRISRLEPAGPRLAFIAIVGFVFAGVAAMVGQALFTVPAMRPDTLAGTAEFAWEFAYILFAISLAALAAHMLALGALILWTKFLPVWMGWLAFVGGIVALVSIIGAGNDASAFTFAQFGGFLLWQLWVLLASILLYMGKDSKA